METGDTMEETIRVLLVEDSEDDSELIQAQLERGGFRPLVKRISTAREMRDSLAAASWDVILSDYAMPLFSGSFALEVLKSSGHDIPFIMVSGVIGDDIAVSCMKAGASDYLLKDNLTRLAPAVRREIIEADRRRERKKKEEAERKIGAENARLYREAKEANRLKDEFLAAVSHELRTPLNAIVGHAELIAQGTLDPLDLSESIDAIYRNALIQQRLVEDLLDISKIINGKMSLSPRSVHLEKLISNAIDSIEAIAKARDVSLVFHSDPALGWGVVDPVRIQQIIWNLLSNAVKFSPRGGVVTVKAMRLDQSFRIEVTDHGKGIDAAFLPHVFERFRQEDGSNTRMHGGLGIGLAITHHLVERHGGTIEAKSPGLGLGATFCVTLPTNGGAELEALAEKTEKPQEKPLEGLQILILDDDADARRLHRTILSRGGAEVTVASSPQEAYTLIENHSYDAFVCDIGMPEESGYSLLARIRRRERGSQRKPLLALAVTAFANAADQQFALASGFQAYLAKPLKASSLVAMVVDALN